ncbi:hypothetical protein DFAR_4040013 [Desulfarculales bacterium]
MKTGGFATTTAWRFKEMLRWIKKATSVRARLVAHHPPRPPCPEVHSA